MKFNESILVLNCGSSSLKFSVIDPIEKTIYLSGYADRLYLKQTNLKWCINNTKYKKNFEQPTTHYEILNIIFQDIFLQEKEMFHKIIAIGHRVVHGGQRIQNSVLITEKIINYIKDSAIFAPLHNPVNLMGIKFSLKNFPKLSKKNVAVFDTSFYASIPKESYLYAIPYNLYYKHGIRRYGAHGISHKYVATQASLILKKPLKNMNIISCHLGNGSSITAIKDGMCIDTSMGLTPLEGLVMGTRCGDIDPSIIFFLYEKLKFPIKKINELLTNHSGLLGISQYSSDFRDLENKYYIDKKSKLAIDMFCYRLRKYISSYFSLMHGKLDAIIFTGGIGENSALVRKKSLNNLTWFGSILLDKDKNNSSFSRKSYYFINKISSIPILIIQTNEELAISQETFKLITSS